LDALDLTQTVDIAAEKLRSSMPWLRLERDGHGWSTVLSKPERLAVSLVATRSADCGEVRAHAVLTDVDVSAAQHSELALFCVVANRTFATWNLLLMPVGRMERVVSVGVFYSERSRESLPPSTVAALTLAAVRAGAVAAPAARAVVEGASAREALALADRVDDILEWSAFDG
jgi:hypothetical protein